MNQLRFYEELIPVSRINTEVFKTGLWGKKRPIYVEGIAPCRISCPAGTDIPLFISFVSKGDFDSALKTILLENPLPSVCGRVCYHPCQANCNRGNFDEPIEIRALERAVGEYGSTKIEIFENQSPKRIAIIGSGPASLSCAFFLLRLGHRVTIFEKEEELGGMLRYGIPPYRLPKDVLNRELARILSLGPEIKTGTKIEGSLLEKLLSSHDFVFLGVGLSIPKRLSIKGIEKEGIYYGLDFLKERIKPQAQDKEAVIIGGGDVAMDVARTLRRYNREMKITICAPEEIEELPALKENLEEVLEEGIEIIGGYLPTVFEGERKVREVRFERVRVLKEGEELKFFVKEGEGISVKADIAVICVGQSPEMVFSMELFSEKGFIKVDEMGKTPIKNLYAGGDIIGGKAAVVDAIASGKKAALAIDMASKGLNRWGGLMIKENHSFSFASYIGNERANLKKVVPFEDLNVISIEKAPSLKVPKENKEERVKDFREVSKSFDRKDVEKEAKRCLSCGLCKKCDLCFLLCPDISIEKEEEGFKIKDEYCKACGICARICPTHIIEMVEKDEGTSIR